MEQYIRFSLGNLHFRESYQLMPKGSKICLSAISDKSKEDILKKDDVLKQYEYSKETLELLVRKGEHPYKLSQ